MSGIGMLDVIPAVDRSQRDSTTSRIIGNNTVVDLDPARSHGR
jgi:hypothetical protein